MKCDYCERTDEQCRIRKIKGVCYCPKHITRHYRKDDMQQLSIYDGNEYVLFDDYAEIILRDKKAQEVARAIIDIEDVDRCKQYKWHTRKNGKLTYVIATISESEKLHLHRFILDYQGDMVIDHINRNTLDNRKSNLRVVSQKENTRNNGATGVKRVPSGRYQACCCRNYRTIYIGTYDTMEEAVRARQEFIASYDAFSQ